MKSARPSPPVAVADRGGALPRAYDNTSRARAAADTAERIGEATEHLLATGPIGAVTLPAIAAEAGVTVQTVLRHMGSRDGCFTAVWRRVEARIDAQRGHSSPGDISGALSSLLAHYEAEGRLVLNLLAQETAEPLAREAASVGRAYHRAWVERCFGPLLPASLPASLSERDRRAVVDALVAATDLYVWKLLRLDLGRSPTDVADAMRRLVRGALPPNPAERSPL